MSKGRTWSRQVEVQEGKGNRERTALVDPSVVTQNKTYFTLNLGAPDYLKKKKTPQNKPTHLCGGNRDLLASRCCTLTY